MLYRQSDVIFSRYGYAALLADSMYFILASFIIQSTYSDIYNIAKETAYVSSGKLLLICATTMFSCFPMHYFDHEIEERAW